MLSNKNSNFQQDLLSSFCWKSVVHEEIVKLVTKTIFINQIGENHDQQKKLSKVYLLDKMLISKFSHTNVLLGVYTYRAL